MTEIELARIALDIAYQVHSRLGPGFSRSCIYASLREVRFSPSLRFSDARATAPSSFPGWRNFTSARCYDRSYRRLS
jgi:hypothetical protein